MLAWILATAAAHVVFLFVVAALLALLLDPLVRALQRMRLPRGFSVALVYLSFLAALVLVILAVATAVVGQTKTAATRFNDYFTHPHGRSGQTSADRDVDRLQALAQRAPPAVDARSATRAQARRADPRSVTSGSTRTGSSTSSRAPRSRSARRCSALVLLVVVSVYMLLDMQRFGRVIDRRFPPRPGEEPLLRSIEHALVSYVRGQALLSLIIGTSAGIGLWVLAATGCFRTRSSTRFSSARGSRVTEVIPYLGPWLGSIPPIVYALVVHPISALWVALLFLGIHQIEGHIVVPNVMGNALRLHPLLVIFGLAAGAEMYGLPGALVALPVLAVVPRALGVLRRSDHARAVAGEPLPVEVELVEPPAAVADT